MALKIKISIILAVVLIIGGICLASQPAYALDEEDYVGILTIDDYSNWPGIHVLIPADCTGCIETLQEVGVDVTDGTLWEDDFDDVFEITRSLVGAYTLYFVGDSESDYFYTNSPLIKLLLRGKFIPRIEGFIGDDTP